VTELARNAANIAQAAGHFCAYEVLAFPVVSHVLTPSAMATSRQIIAKASQMTFPKVMRPDPESGLMAIPMNTQKPMYGNIVRTNLTNSIIVSLISPLH
jgi:hypothetical protein